LNHFDTTLRGTLGPKVLVERGGKTLSFARSAFSVAPASPLATALLLAKLLEALLYLLLREHPCKLLLGLSLLASERLDFFAEPAGTRFEHPPGAAAGKRPFEVTPGVLELLLGANDSPFQAAGLRCKVPAAAPLAKEALRFVGLRFLRAGRFL
jgi:hypothetical protein